MNSVYLYLALSCLVATAGCSVAVESVPNRPPDLRNVGVTKLETPEYGNFEVSDSIPTTFFMLPMGMTEKQVSERFLALGLISQQIDGLTATILAPDFQTLPDLFNQAGCPALASSPDVAIDSTNIVWRKLDAADPRQATLSMCKEYVEKNQAVPEYTDALAKFSDLIKDGGGLIDFSNIELKLLNPADVGLKDLSLKFQSGFATYSTSPSGSERPIFGAIYIPGKRALAFAFDELKDGKPTGLMYKVMLERSEDFLTFARFKGDANLIDASGQVVQNGSFQLTGTITK